ncbi:hypothetical protein TrVE_jg2427 [Triparma verrucosa]|uniref:UBC core domain-containing protein n=2 Tax=Triparma TaxID=722752 RepID=A0A9W7AGH0_9STRA|nr:hypothetical protein TrST_g12405 [Triparma strigata]GMI06155.1 hypothetical protein TrVE_jg2427 [Triparma verrucosa]
MATDMCRRRLQREYVSLSKSPLPGIKAIPDPDNILSWHFLLRIPDAPYSNGVYWGVLKFPQTYPLKPPSVLVHTPSGRFKPSRRLCLSMSDYHPETWNPMWSVGTVLLGLQTFWASNDETLGSINASAQTRTRLANESMSWNCRDKKFKMMFDQEYQKFIDEGGKITPENPNDVMDNKSFVFWALGVGFLFLAAVVRMLVGKIF